MIASLGGCDGGGRVRRAGSIGNDFGSVVGLEVEVEGGMNLGRRRQGVSFEA